MGRPKTIAPVTARELRRLVDASTECVTVIAKLSKGGLALPPDEYDKLTALIESLDRVRRRLGLVSLRDLRKTD